MLLLETVFILAFKVLALRSETDLPGRLRSDPRQAVVLHAGLVVDRVLRLAEVLVLKVKIGTVDKPTLLERTFY